MDRTAIFVREALGDRNDDDRDIYSLIRELRAALAAAKKKAEEEARLREVWSVAARCAPNGVQEAVRDLVGELEMRLVETANQLKKAEAERDEAREAKKKLAGQLGGEKSQRLRTEREIAALRSRVAELEGHVQNYDDLSLLRSKDIVFAVQQSTSSANWYWCAGSYGARVWERSGKEPSQHDAVISLLLAVKEEGAALAGAEGEG